MIPGKQVRLRPVEREDLARYVQWLSDQELRNHLASYKPIGREQEVRWFERNLEAGDSQAWAIDALQAGAASPTWDHIGACGFHHIDWRNRVAEVGIFLGEKGLWGKGYGTEATRSLVGYGFETLNLNRIELRVFSDNPRAMRCYQKVGFTIEGRLRQSDFRNGAYRDTVIMALLLSEWGRPKS